MREGKEIGRIRETERGEMDGKKRKGKEKDVVLSEQQEHITWISPAKKC